MKRRVLLAIESIPSSYLGQHIVHLHFVTKFKSWTLGFSLRVPNRPWRWEPEGGSTGSALVHGGMDTGQSAARVGTREQGGVRRRAVDGLLVFNSFRARDWLGADRRPAWRWRMRGRARLRWRTRCQPRGRRLTRRWSAHGRARWWRSTRSVPTAGPPEGTATAWARQLPDRASAGADVDMGGEGMTGG